MRSQHHSICMWFRPNLASPGAVPLEVNSIVFACGLDQTSLHRELLHQTSTISSLYVVQAKLRFTESSYVRRKHHRLCMWSRPNLTSSGAVTSDVNIIVFVIQTKPRFTGSSYMRRKHHRLCMWFRPNPPHWEQLHEEKTSSSLYVDQTKPASLGEAT